RDIYYQRELTLKVSLSYGPGRHDPEYEERGHDYPIAYVRWIEARNIEAFLDLLAAQRIDVKPLITHRFSIDEAPRAYQLIAGRGDEKYLAVLLTYDTGGEVERRIENPAARKAAAGITGVSPATREPSGAPAQVRIGLIGAGGYAQKML